MYIDLSIGDGDNDYTSVLEIQPTDEGLVLDAYYDGVHQGTIAMTYREWFESMLGECLHCHKSLVANKLGIILDLDTGGDICGALGTNHAHCSVFSPSDENDEYCDHCGLPKEDHSGEKAYYTWPTNWPRLDHPEHPEWEQLEFDLGEKKST